MSSTANTALTLNQLLELADKYMPGEHVIRDYGWDFKNEKLLPPETLEPVPKFVVEQIKDNFEPGARDVVQVSDIISEMQKVANTLTEFQRSLQCHLHWMLIKDFWTWLKESKRTQYTTGLFQSWIEVHPLDLVRETKPNLMALIHAQTPLKDSPNPVIIGPEVIAEMDVTVSRKLHVQLEEPVVTTGAADVTVVTAPTT